MENKLTKIKEQVLFYKKIVEENKKIALAFGGVIILTAFLTISATNYMNKKAETATNSVADSTSMKDSMKYQNGIETGYISIGSTTPTFTSENSWPAELISSSNLEVQPGREGTIASWDVHIGQKVYAGQTLGRLSSAPRTPDVVQALASQSESLTRAKAQAEADVDFNAKKITQLESQRSLTLSQNNITKPSVKLKEDKLRAIVRDSLYKLYPKISIAGIQSLSSKSTVAVSPSFNAIDSNAQNAYANLIKEIMLSIENNNLTREQGIQYFSKTLLALSYTLADGDKFTNASISEMKTQVLTDKSDYEGTIREIEDLQVNNSDRNVDREQKLKDIDSQILQLEKDLALSKAEVLAKQASYNTVVGGLTGNLEIFAPKSGIVSNILKKPGEFVSPGLSIAVVTSQEKNNQIVRIHIPNNIKKPTIGDTLSVTRPGYSQDIKKIRLIGIGSSLDETGSYSADATLSDTTDWPIGISLRVLAPIESSTILIKLTSLVWDDNGIPKVWLISPAGRIYGQRVKIGRTVGTDVEISEGLKNNDMYIVNPTSEVKENVLIDDIKGPDTTTGGESSYDKMMKAMGM